MTEAIPATNHHAPEARTDNSQHAHESGGIASWASDFAASAWGATKVVGHVVAGAAHEVVEHPLKTAGEVAVGVAAGVAAAELGVGLAAGAVAAGAVMVGYGAVRGVQIAAREGVGAIPGHMSEAYQEAKKSAGDVLSAAGSVYRGESGKKGEDAAAVLENVGRAAVPVAAMAVGGAAGDAAKAALRGGVQVLEDLLPPLTIGEPALAYAGGGIAGGARAIAQAGGRLSVETGALVGATGAGASYMTREGEGGGMSDYDRQQHFIDGKKIPGPVEAPEGPAAEVGKGFRDIDQVLKDGGTRGYFKFQNDGKGWYSVEVTDGPLKGRTGIWERGSTKFQFDGIAGHIGEFELPK
jgi:hypothetical protein